MDIKVKVYDCVVQLQMEKFFWYKFFVDFRADAEYGIYTTGCGGFHHPSEV